MKVGDIMTTDPVCVKESDLMTHARQVLRDNNLHGLPVLNGNGSVLGMLDDQDILRVKSNKSDVTVGGYIRETPLITPDTDVREAAKLLLQARQHRCAVVRSSTDRTIMGIISDKNILRNAHISKMEPKAVADVMNTRIITAYPDDSIAKIWGNMLEWDYTGIPVISHEDEVMGIITRGAILKAGFARTIDHSSEAHDSVAVDSPKVEKLMITPLYSISPGITVSKAIEALIDYDIGRICVTKDKCLVGMVDRFSLLKECLQHPCFD
ncbi:CBS domain-containing protein [Methanolobus sediminis]|uniref:CBS domain-containing protein n=1 Tax=Methanolobus sediminis TaxID=3072978 RepID=A0AA51UKT2_9EURY|nr:CBS domain-containing protein [Methanolobus sediminis]WMW24151.1 CBS domain-containing protein [Methanolobus sediminis]